MVPRHQDSSDIVIKTLNDWIGQWMAGGTGTLSELASRADLLPTANHSPLYPRLRAIW